MSRRTLPKAGAWALAFLLLAAGPSRAQEESCFESRQGASELKPATLSNGLPTVKCSAKTGAVLWWGDPFVGTVEMRDKTALRDNSAGVAMVRPREDKIELIAECGVDCHDGEYPPPPKDKNPRSLKEHKDVVPDALNLAHGRGAIWCLDCHHPATRNKLIDNFGMTISFNEPEKLCGKCHGPAYRDWRDGIHGKRIGEWASNGRKRWFLCTECHDPHDVQQGTRNSGFAQIEPEHAPMLPKGLKNAAHERPAEKPVASTGGDQRPLFERLKRWLERMVSKDRTEAVVSKPAGAREVLGGTGAQPMVVAR